MDSFAKRVNDQYEYYFYYYYEAKLRTALRTCRNIIYNIVYTTYLLSVPGKFKIIEKFKIHLIVFQRRKIEPELKKKKKKDSPFTVYINGGTL